MLVLEKRIGVFWLGVITDKMSNNPSSSFIAMNFVIFAAVLLSFSVQSTRNPSADANRVIDRIGSGEATGFNYVLMPRTHEGITKWSYIISDVVDITRSLNNSVLIEPCLLDSRVSPCWEDKAFPMSMVFDMEDTSKANPSFKWMKWEEFQKKNYLNFEWIGCTIVGEYDSVKNLQHQWGNFSGRENRTLNMKSYDACMRKADDLVADDGKDRLTWLAKPWIKQVHREGRSYEKKRVDIPIKREVYDQVHKLLNVSEYLAFNWRSEERSWLKKKECVPGIFF